MAERQRTTGKKRAVKPAATGKPAPATEAVGMTAGDSAGRIRMLETERDRLTAELEAAHARIAALEQAREQVLNRIDWVIDSLHSLQSE